MASIVPIVIGCIDYLAYGTLFTHAMFRPKIKLDVFFFTRKAADDRWEVVCGQRQFLLSLSIFFEWSKIKSKEREEGAPPAGTPIFGGEGRGRVKGEEIFEGAPKTTPSSVREIRFKHNIMTNIIASLFDMATLACAVLDLLSRSVKNKM